MLSDDELDERVREAHARVEFAVAGVVGSMDRAAKMFAELGTLLADTIAAEIDQMDYETFAQYQHLRSMGVLPLDAAVLLTATDDEVAAHLEDVRD